MNDILDNLQKAAEIHKQIRKKAYDLIKPNVKYYDITKSIYDMIQEEHIKNPEINIAFPIGFSVNNIVAHDSSYPSDIRILKTDDVLKLDIGIHCNGYIIDSARTLVINNNNTNNLILSTKEATEIAIKNSGVDVRLYELSELIQETIESYEYYDNKIKAIGVLGGHNIERYKIHGGKLILSKPNDIQQNMKMNENEIFAIETFATTGNNNIYNVSDTDIQHTHFMRNDNIKLNLFNKHIKKYEINNYFDKLFELNKNLPFNKFWINTNKPDKLKKEIYELVNCKFINAYAPLADNKGALTSQEEHTIFIKESGIINLSKSDDY